MPLPFCWALFDSSRSTALLPPPGRDVRPTPTRAGCCFPTRRLSLRCGLLHTHHTTTTGCLLLPGTRHLSPSPATIPTRCCAHAGACLRCANAHALNNLTNMTLNSFAARCDATYVTLCCADLTYSYATHFCLYAVGYHCVCDALYLNLRTSGCGYVAIHLLSMFALGLLLHYLSLVLPPPLPLPVMITPVAHYLLRLPFSSPLL